MSALNYRWKLWRLEALVYWLEAPKPDRGGWLRFGALVALTLEVEVIMALWLMGAFKP
jgi:hypothetical protein